MSIAIASAMKDTSAPEKRIVLHLYENQEQAIDDYEEDDRQVRR